MALHADFHAAVEREPGGIDDRAAQAFGRRPLPCGFNMRLSGAVPTLAINPSRQPCRKSRASLSGVRPGLDRNIAVVTGHAPIADLATEAGVVGPVVAGTHRPIATTLRIPGDRKLYQLSGPGSAEVTPR